MVEKLQQRENLSDKFLAGFRAEEAKLQAEVNESLKDVMKKYLTKNITINGAKVDLSKTDAKVKLEQDEKDANLFTLSFTNKFDGLKLQADTDILTKVQFRAVKESNNYYVQFDASKSTFDNKDVKLTTTDAGTELLYGDVIYDLAVPNLKLKTTDIRIEANATKTNERILKKVADQKFESLVKISDKPEFENTKLSGLNAINLSKEVTAEVDGYSRTIYMYDATRTLYRPVSKIYFDKVGNLDKTKTADFFKEKNASNPFTVLGEKLGLQRGRKSGVLQFDFQKEDVTKLEARLTAHREKLITYIDEAKIGAPGKFTEFDKIDKERPRHKGETKFLFETTELDLNLINDTYILTSGREDNQTIRFGFDINATDPTKDKIYIKDLKGNKVDAKRTIENGTIKSVKNAFDIRMDANNVFNVFDNDGQLTIFKAKESDEHMPTAYPTLAGAGAAYVTETTLHQYEAGTTAKSKGKTSGQMKYYSETDGKQIMQLPVDRNIDNEWKLNEVSTAIKTDDLIEMTNFAESSYQNLNITQEDLKSTFNLLMQKEKIKLVGRGSVRVLTDASTGKYEYFVAEQKKDGEAISLPRDKELYDAAERVTKMMLKRLDVINKVENVELYYINKGAQERFEGAIGGGRGLEKSSLTTKDKVDFLLGNQDELTQSILWDEGTSDTVVVYKVKGKDVDFDLKDSKAMKLDGTWSLKKKLVKKIDVQDYKVRLEAGSVYKLIFDPIEGGK